MEQIRDWLDGEDEIDPPIQFPPPEFGGPVVTFSRWSELSGMCGGSRVWGGMHFEVKRPRLLLLSTNIASLHANLEGIHRLAARHVVDCRPHSPA